MAGAGPGWNKTLLFVAYDDAGGYYDHVVPPMEGVPADEAPCHLTGPDTNPPYKCPGGGNAFDFRRCVRALWPCDAPSDGPLIALSDGPLIAPSDGPLPPLIALCPL